VSVVIKAIKFNHDSSSADHNALNIRKNKSEFITVPEWEEGVSTNADDSLAAYAIKETRGKTINIQAKFFADGINSAQIRAIAVPAVFDPTELRGCGGLLIKIFINLILALVGDVLGDVKAKWVNFDAGGDSGYVSFELKNPKLEQAGVGYHYTTWKWQYRLSSVGPWIDVGTTRHKIYVLLEVPKDPWKQSPYSAANDQLPWTEVMEYACTWAILSKDRDTAASKVTEQVNKLGPSFIWYDKDRGRTNYSLYDFDCTQFLDRIKGSIGLGGKVNCTDCATITSTFANILGCALWQSRMGNSFECNPIIAIGYSNWEVPFYGSFNYHEVAWKGACDVDDEVFDACLKVDGDSDPTAADPAHTPLLPVNLKFGTCAPPFQYRDRLASPSGCSSCVPKPASTRQRRQVI
jgi:hypothetical protein